ncbi:MAG: 23S rRNA (cytosine1962-C5)-methyltransferase [Myxococcota bacterium]|jgi:23S rRNA (cytosine1962-C5)-methyltransferase
MTSRGDRVTSSTAQVPIVHLAKDLRESIEGGHPWIFDRALRKLPESLRPGQLVRIAHRDKVLGTGFVDPSGPIAVRILQLGDNARIDSTWVRKTSESAAKMRATDWQLTTTNAYRLFHGENDFMPGLVVDLYDGTGVVSFDGAAARNFWIEHIAAVHEGCRDAGVEIVRLWARPLRRTGGVGVSLYGDEPPQTITIEEHGARFEVDVRRGQKTGFFLDQRENRRMVAGLAGGSTVLNLFGYTGGFSVHAALGGARHVTTVDIAAPAIEAARRNFSLNGLNPKDHAFAAEDVFRYMERIGSEQFDIVICDPPSFAPNKQARGQALQAYRRLNAAAIERVLPGGLLVTASCSSHITVEDMLEVVRSAAVKSRRRARVQQIFGAGSCHPVRPAFPEGRYLKLLVVYVD